MARFDQTVSFSLILVAVIACGKRSGPSPRYEIPERGPRKDTPSSTPCVDADATQCGIEQALVAATNRLRQTNGKAPLAFSGELTFVARDWSKRQADSAQISHEGFPEDRLRLLRERFPGADVGVSAENVAMNSFSATADAEAIATRMIAQWENSPGHKANMLGRYQTMGASVAKRGTSYYATQIFD